MPNGLSVRSWIEAISRSRLAASKAEVPSVPNPPALETAATSGAVVALPMPPNTIGWGMLSRSQMRVRIMTPPFWGTAYRLISTWFLISSDSETSASDNFRQPMLSLLHLFHQRHKGVSAIPFDPDGTPRW